MKKTALTILAMATILTSTFLVSGIPSAAAYLHTTVQSDQIYSGGNVIGKYGCSSAYDASGGAENDRSFFPTMEVKTNNEGYYSYHIHAMKIEVSGTKPNGQAISGNELTPISHITSPSDENEDWYAGLETVYNVIRLAEPTGLASTIMQGSQTDGDYIRGFSMSQGNPGNSVWVQYTNLASWGFSWERGIQLKFQLHCESDLGGTYTLNIHYWYQLVYPDNPVMITRDIYETIYYEFTPPYVDSIVSSGTISGYGEAGSADNMIGYETDGDYAYLLTYQAGDGAEVIGHMDTTQAGHTDISVYGMDTGSPSHIYVYVSENCNNDWETVQPADFFTDCSTTPHLIYIGYATTTFNYIAFASYNSNGDPPSAFFIDCVIAT
jgi:hypothetical protein